jgi:hypothetical protein
MRLLFSVGPEPDHECSLANPASGLVDEALDVVVYAPDVADEKFTRSSRRRFLGGLAAVAATTGTVEATSSEAEATSRTAATSSRKVSSGMQSARMDDALRIRDEAARMSAAIDLPTHVPMATSGLIFPTPCPSPRDYRTTT